MSPALQISIPQTSISATPGQKPFTSYHVVLQLPLRRQETKKRYTDFVRLQQDLVAQGGAAPPKPLPAKRWFSRTVNNEALTEERRIALEQYLQAIIGSDDGRWRRSEAWRTFLGLQSDANTSSASYTSLSRPQALDAGEWLELHRKLKARLQEARQQVKQRDAASTPQQQHHIAAEAKANLVRAATMIEELDSGLAATKSDTDSGPGHNQLGGGEWRRRRDLVNSARQEVQALDGVLRTAARTTPSTSDAAFEDAGAHAKQGDARLFGGRPKQTGRVLGGPAKETERTRELDNDGVLQLQQQIMQEQDEDVMVLGKTITKLKDMGVLMNEELAIQNEMLRVVDEDVDRVQAKIDVGRRRIQKIK